MIRHFDIAPREALAAPTEAWQTYVQSVAVLIVSVLSALGAGWIMLSFACFKSLRSFRHQLILGLAISDSVMALNFLSSSGMNIGGRFIGAEEQRGFCSFNGWMTQAFVIQTDYWVLTIAICTYFILADWKRAASWVQDQLIFLMIIPWFFSILWASIGLGVTGYGNIGAWCWFTSDEVRLLVNFIPRWLIIVTMLAMYARLYLVLFKAHKFMSSDEESSGHPGSGSRSRTLDAAANISGARPADNDNSHSAYARGLRPPETSKRLKKLARLMLMYPIAYMLIWTLPTCVRIYQASSGSPAPFSVQTIDKACIVLQGFVDAVIYGVNESSLSSWRNLLFPQAFPTIDGNSASPSTRHHHLGDGGEKKKTPRGVPADRLSDLGTRDDSTSSFDIIADGSSATQITGAASSGREMGGTDGDVELRTLHVYAGTGNGSNSSAFGIRKTVEVNVVSEVPARTHAKGKSFFDG